VVIRVGQEGEGQGCLAIGLFKCIDLVRVSGSVLDTSKGLNMPTLTIELPGLPLVSHVLKDETITIGRMKGNTIVIEDSSISLMHAKITRKDGLFYLKDLNSTNGTVVNGQPISEARLHDLDRVRFADVTGQFLAEAGAVTGQPILNAVSEQPVKAQPSAGSRRRSQPGPATDGGFQSQAADCISRSISWRVSGGGCRFDPGLELFSCKPPGLGPKHQIPKLPSR